MLIKMAYFFKLKFLYNNFRNIVKKYKILYNSIKCKFIKFIDSIFFILIIIFYSYDIFRIILNLINLFLDHFLFQKYQSFFYLNLDSNYYLTNHSY